MIIPNIWKNKKCSKPPTRSIHRCTMMYHGTRLFTTAKDPCSLQRTRRPNRRDLPLPNRWAGRCPTRDGPWEHSVEGIPISTSHYYPGWIYIYMDLYGIIWINNSNPIDRYWLVVDLPLWKIWVRQLGWWNSQYMEIHRHVPNHLWTTGHFLRPLVAALSPPPGPPNQLITEAEGADGARPGLPLPHGTARGELTGMVGSGENKHAGDIYRWYIYQ